MQNSETHKFRDMVDNLLQYVPLFKQAKIKSLKDLDGVETSTVQKNMSRACDAAELRLRKAAKERGTTSKDANESTAGGMEAAKHISELRGKLGAVAKWYESDLEDRFFSVATAGPDSVRLTEEGINETHENIEKSSSLFAKELHTSLDKLATLSKEVETADMLNFVPSSPMEHVIAKPKPIRTMERQPVVDEAEKNESGDGGGGGGGDDGDGGGENGGKRGRGPGRPQGSKNKMQKPDAADPPQPKPTKDDESGSSRLTVKQSASLLAKVETLQQKVQGMQQQLDAVTRERDVAKAENARLQSDIAHGKELANEKIKAAASNAKLQALEWFMQQAGGFGGLGGRMMPPSSAQGSSSGGSAGPRGPSPFFSHGGSDEQNDGV